VKIKATNGSKLNDSPGQGRRYRGGGDMPIGKLKGNSPVDLNGT